MRIAALVLICCVLVTAHAAAVNWERDAAAAAAAAGHRTRDAVHSENQRRALHDVRDVQSDMATDTEGARKVITAATAHISFIYVPLGSLKAIRLRTPCLKEKRRCVPMVCFVLLELKCCISCHSHLNEVSSTDFSTG